MARARMEVPAFRVDRIDLPDAQTEFRFAGRLSFRDLYAAWGQVRSLIAAHPPSVRFDVSAVEALDGGATALLLELKSEVSATGAAAEIVGAEGRVRAMLDLYGQHPPRPTLQAPPQRIGIFDQIGRETLTMIADSNALDYIGDVTVAAGRAVRAPLRVNWRDVGRLMERAGADGLPIVLLISFLVGLVTAFQAAIQLRQFGANIFVADLVALSITRELGPLMTAIIIAGRSGAAFSAELGTMKVSEEIDALQTLGLDPHLYLVFPRVIALMLVMPLLTVLSDIVGILGGLLVGMLSLDLTVHGYLLETEKALHLWDIGSGMLKSVVFALNIALIACQRGLATRGGAEGVGRATTSAVVSSLFALVVLDALFTVLFNAFGL
jgi:phospholipid/cholesterol/gamma-HCH transport system permease protein